MKQKFKKNTSQGRLQSTIKVLVSIFFILFLTGFTIAEELIQFDNSKSYDSVTQTITIKNTFNLGRTFADIKLNTPLNVQTGFGGVFKVAEFQITNYEDYTNAIDGMKFYNIKEGMKEVSKDYELKYKVMEEVNVNDYDYVCVPDATNKTSGKRCVLQVVKTHSELQEKWYSLEKLDFLEGEVLTIGIFTYVNEGDNVEWIMNAYGKELTEWASWTASLSVGLFSYYKLDDLNTQSTAKDELGNHDGTANPITLFGTTGKINNAVNLTTTNVVYLNDTLTNFVSLSHSGSVSLWVKFNAEPMLNRQEYIWYHNPSGDDRFWIISQNGNILNIGCGDGSVGSNSTIVGGTWYNVVMVWNGASCWGYINGVVAMQYTYAFAEFTTNNQSSIGRVGQPLNAVVDELGMWTRRLTPTEITDLYNGGLGLPYGVLPTPQVTLNSPIAYYNTSNANVSFDITATDAQQVANVTLYIDAVLNETRTSLVNGTYKFDKILTDGLHNWSILAYNNNSNSNQSDTRNFTINTTAYLSADAPANFTNLTYNNVSFNATIFGWYNIKNVTLFLDGLANTTITTGLNGSYNISLKLNDGNYNWSMEVWSGNLGTVPNKSKNYTVTVDTTYPKINLSHPTNTTYYTTVASSNNVSTFLNVTIIEANPDKCWYSYDGNATNYTLTCNSNATIYTIFGTNTTTFWVNDTSGNVNSSTITFTNKFYLLANNQTYSDATYETKNETFYLNTTIDSSVTKVGAFLVYNGTYYGATTSCIGTDCRISKRIDIPLMTSKTLETENKSFSWQLTMFGNFGTASANTSSLNQNVSDIIFKRCDYYNAFNNSINYSIYNESTNALVTASFRSDFDYWMGEGTVKDNYYYGGDGQNNYTFCVNKNLTFLTDAHIEINNSVDSRIYQFVNQYYNNIVKLQKLFLPDSAYISNIIIEVKDEGLVPMQDVTVNISRYYPATNSYEVVEHKTTDEFGQVLAKLIQSNVKYKFSFYDANGVLLKTSDQVTVICRSSICVIPFVITTEEDYLHRYDNITLFEYELSFSNSTNTFTYSWVDSTGDAAVHRLEVTRYKFNESTTVCNTTSTSSVASLTCAVGGSSSSYTAQTFRKVATKETRISLLNAIVGDISQTFGMEGLFWVFILLMICIGIGVYDPKVGAIIYGAGFIFMGLIHIIHMPTPVFFANTILVVIFIWAIKT